LLPCFLASSTTQHSRSPSSHHLNQYSVIYMTRMYGILFLGNNLAAQNFAFFGERKSPLRPVPTTTATKLTTRTSPAQTGNHCSLLTAQCRSMSPHNALSSSGTALHCNLFLSVLPPRPFVTSSLIRPQQYSFRLDKNCAHAATQWQPELCRNTGVGSKNGRFSSTTPRILMACARGLLRSQPLMMLLSAGRASLHT